MNWNKRPLSVMILGCLYIAVGTIGFVYHFSEIWGRGTFHYDAVLVELVSLLAVVSGVFMLRGENWARWVALAWIAFHVVLSAFHTLQEFAIHCLFCAVIAWLLFRREGSRYFRLQGSNKDS